MTTLDEPPDAFRHHLCVRPGTPVHPGTCDHSGWRWARRAASLSMALRWGDKGGFDPTYSTARVQPYPISNLTAGKNRIELQIRIWGATWRWWSTPRRPVSMASVSPGSVAQHGGCGVMAERRCLSSCAAASHGRHAV